MNTARNSSKVPVTKQMEDLDRNNIVLGDERHFTASSRYFVKCFTKNGDPILVGNSKPLTIVGGIKLSPFNGQKSLPGYYMVLKEQQAGLLLKLSQAVHRRLADLYLGTLSSDDSPVEIDQLVNSTGKSTSQDCSGGRWFINLDEDVEFFDADRSELPLTRELMNITGNYRLVLHFHQVVNSVGKVMIKPKITQVQLVSTKSGCMPRQGVLLLSPMQQQQLKRPASEISTDVQEEEALQGDADGPLAQSRPQTSQAKRPATTTTTTAVTTATGPSSSSFKKQKNGKPEDRKRKTGVCKPYDLNARLDQVRVNLTQQFLDEDTQHF